MQDPMALSTLTKGLKRKKPCSSHAVIREHLCPAETCWRHSSQPGSSEGCMLLSPPSRCFVRPTCEEFYSLGVDTSTGSPSYREGCCVFTGWVSPPMPIRWVTLQEALESGQAAQRRLRWRETQQMLRLQAEKSVHSGLCLIFYF